MADSKPSWRKKGQSSRRRAPAAPGAATSAWQARPVDAAQTALFRQRLRLTGLALLALLLIGCFLIIVLWIGKQTPLVLLTVTQYTTPIPPNAYAVEDLQQLRGVNAKNLKSVPDEFGGRVSGKELLDHLDKQLTTLKPGGPGKDVVLLYLSAHGVVNEANEPCLLLSDSQPLDSSTWLRLSDLFARLKPIQSRPAPGGRKIVLLLDAGRIDDDWSLGLLYNGFAELVEPTLQAADVPGLYVLNAAGAGEIAFAAPELNGTAFGYYLALGLDGQARGGDNRITLRELTEYVQRNVARWTLHHRAEIQQPLLTPPLSADQDFAVAFASRPTTVAEPATARSARQRDIADRQSAVQKLWQPYQEILRSRDLTAKDPVGLADLQHHLLRAEQLLWAGAGYRQELTDTLGEIESWLRLVGQTPLPAGLQVSSLPLAAQLEPLDRTAGLRADLLAAWRAAGGRPQPPEGPPPPLGYLTAADIAWNWLADFSQPGPRQLREVTDFVAAATPRTSAPAGPTATPDPSATIDVVEIAWLRMLLAHADWPAAGSPAENALTAALQPSIRARRWAEQAAAPAEHRVHYWIQSRVDQADLRRRVAEDLLLVGDEGSLQKARTLYGELLGDEAQSGQYPAAVQRAGEVAQWIAVRDRAWVELPYLTQWLGWQCRTGPLTEIGEDPWPRLEQAIGSLDAVRKLAAELDRGLSEEHQEASTGLAESARQLQEVHGQVREVYGQYANYLDLKAGRDKPTLRRIGQLLRLPLLDASQRGRLADKYLTILFTEADLASAAASAGDAAADVPDDARQRSRQLAADYQRRLAGWTRHPALETLERSDLTLLPEQRVPAQTAREAGRSDLQWLAYQGGQVRRLLGDVLAAANDLERVTQTRLVAADETAANIRAGLSQADRLARAAATLLTGRTWEKPELDPAYRLGLLDRHFQMLWHGHRALEDFWGSPPGTRGEPYFVRAATLCLNSARALNDTPRSLRHNREDLEQLLARRAEAARQITVQAEDVFTLQTDESARHAIEVRWPPDVPRGVSAIFVRRGADGPAADGLLPLVTAESPQAVRRIGRPVSADQPRATVDEQIPLAELQVSGEGVDLDAVCLYRGHVVPRRFRVRWPGFVTQVEVEPRMPPTASITVRGEGQRTGNVMFVFDCSGSMSKNQRINKAKDSLRAVLESLRTEGKYQVGLRCYGRRAKFTDETDCSRKAYIESAQAEHPYPDTDVERLVPIGPLDEKQHARIVDRFADLQPWGQTPLYYALKQSLREDDFLIAKRGEPKRLIVITDGLNFQTSCLQIERQGAPTSQAQVLQAREEDEQCRDVQIDIIGLEVRGNIKPSEERQLQELQDLAEKTGGRYYDANDTASLVKALRETLQLVQFSVSGPGADTFQKDPLDLGGEWRIPQVPPAGADYEVRLHGIDRAPFELLTLQGGEALQLAYDKVNRELTFPPYEPRAFDPHDDRRGREQSVDDPAGRGRFTVQGLLPQRIGQDVLFFVYVQREQPDQFTPRPRHVWAEIRPVGPLSNRVYYFSDADFVPERPVPVFRFLARQWPREAQDAQINLWFQFAADAAPPESEGPVDPLRPVPVTVPSLPGVQFEIRSESLADRAYRVIVTERQAADSAVTPARVQIQPPPDERILHSFFAGVNVLKHEFKYAEQKPATVSITSRDLLIRGSLEAQRLQVPVED